MICCKECLDLLCDYLDGELEQGTVVALEEHFQDCPPCIAFLRTYKTTTKLCRENLKEIELPAEVQSKLAEFVKTNLHKQE